MSLSGYHALCAFPVTFIGENPTPAEREAHEMGAAAMLCGWARDEVAKAYAAVRRYPTDRKFGRIDRNPEARIHMEKARRYLETLRWHLAQARQVQAARLLQAEA